jgi:hypothetical protein
MIRSEAGTTEDVSPESLNQDGRHNQKHHRNRQLCCDKQIAAPGLCCFDVMVSADFNAGTSPASYW